MKRLLLLISFSIFCLYSFTQIDVQRDNRVNPILKLAVTPKSGYFVYGRSGASRFIDIAVVNQSSHAVSWFTCHGRLFDSTRLTDREYEQVTSKRLDPFALYQNICDRYLADIAVARDIYRVNGDKQSFDKLHSNYRAVFAMETVQAAKTPLQKLIAIENVRKHILTQLAYLNCASPSALSDDPLYRSNKEQAGVMIKTDDSTVYYNIDPTSAVAKICLYKNSPEKLYVFNRISRLIDSVTILPAKYELLQKEKMDVFLLYRGWLEMQWQEAMSTLKRRGSDAGDYGQYHVKNEETIEKGLYNQLNAIGRKIDQLIVPEAKSIEQAVFDTYKSETSEITYIPLLGIGYDLVQKRGVKEYELTNHLGNVLATVSDKKIGVTSSANSSLIDHYEPDIVSAQDYYPFGMLQPGRAYLSATGDKYRYGFNGKENDNEVKGEGEQLDYGMRVYDPRLGRFLSVDPLTMEYPWYTPYQFAGNTPIRAVDVDGLEPAYPYQDSKGQWREAPAGDNLNRNNLPSGHVEYLRKSSSLPSKQELNEQASATLDFIPIVNEIKGIHQALTGKEWFTDRELDLAERVLVLIPYLKRAHTRSVQRGIAISIAKKTVARELDPMTAEMSRPLNGVMPKFSEFAWQKNKAMNDIIAKSIHGNVFNKKGPVGEVGFELENGVITPKALGKDLTNEAKAYIINVGYKQMQAPGFNGELLEKVNEALNSGQIPMTTNRYEKLLEMQRMLTPQPPPAAR